MITTVCFSCHLKMINFIFQQYNKKETVFFMQEILEAVNKGGHCRCFLLN